MTKPTLLTHRERKYAEAVEAYTQCLVNDPDLHIARANRAATYVRLGMWPQVEDDCNVVLAKDPAYVKVGGGRRWVGAVGGWWEQ